MPAMLPPRFCWRPLWVGSMRLDAYALFDGDVEVARVTKRVSGDGWWAAVNRPLDHPRRGGARYSRMDTAFRDVEAWAAANSARLPGGACRPDRLRP